MEKQVITADVPETGGPFNLAVTYGNLIFISGLPPFDENYCGDQGRMPPAMRPASVHSDVGAGSQPKQRPTTFIPLTPFSPRE
jgi:hypothetical protein